MSGRKSKARRRLAGPPQPSTAVPEEVPFGYRRDESGAIVVVPEEAAIVQRAFRLSAGGMSPRRIAEVLNAEAAEGIVTPYVPIAKEAP